MRLSRNTELAPPPLRIEGRTIIVKSIAYDDWLEWSTLRAASRDFLAPWEAIWPIDALSETAFERRVRRAGQDWQSEDGYAFHIFDRLGGRLIGGIALSQVYRGISQHGTLGYWMGQQFAGKGYMTDAVSALSNFAFTKLSLHRLHAACIPENIASQKVLEKNGFLREGYARRYLKIAGVWADHYLYAKLADDL
jgi:ribosomal-protein-alanine N-acetyltransferase